MDNIHIKDKAVFIVGLMAIFLSLTTFKDTLSKIIVPAGDQIFTMWNLIVFLISTLMISVYLFALSYIQPSFGKYQDAIIIKWIFKIIIFIANFCYSIALIFPLIVVISSIYAGSPFGKFNKDHAIAFGIFDLVSAIVLIISSMFNAYFLSKKKENL